MHFHKHMKSKASLGCKVQSEAPTGSQVDTVSPSTGATQFEQGRTFKVFVQDVLEAVEDGFVILDFLAFAGVRPLFSALEVGVDLTSVGGVLLVMGHLQTKRTESDKIYKYFLGKHRVCVKNILDKIKLGYWSLSVISLILRV